MSPIRMLDGKILMADGQIVNRADEDPSCCCGVPWSTSLCPGLFDGGKMPLSLTLEVTGVGNGWCTNCASDMNGTHEMPFGPRYPFEEYCGYEVNFATHMNCGGGPPGYFYLLFMKYSTTVYMFGQLAIPGWQSVSVPNYNHVITDPLDFDITLDFDPADLVSGIACNFTNLAMRVYPTGLY